MMNKTLLVACAMRVEADYFICNLDDVKEIKVNNFSFYEGSYKDCKVVVLVSGPGVINMASGLTIGIYKYQPSYIFNYGVVGAIKENIHQGDIIIGNRCMNIGSYMTGKLDKGLGVDLSKWRFMTFTDGGRDRVILWDADKELVNSVLEIKESYNNGKVFLGRIGSSDSWDKEYDKLIMLRDNYGIICEDMECISVYQVSNMFDIPCLSVKVVSDNAIIGEEYDKSVLESAKEFIMLLLKNLCDNIMKNDEIEGE